MTIDVETGAVNSENTVELNNGVKMPILGLGTSHSGGYSHSAVVYALKECGYRLIDTAKRYGVEEMLRTSIKESGIEREELFLVTKMWPTDYGYRTTRLAVEGSIKRLGTDYLDMYMLHFPVCCLDCGKHKLLLEETWRAMEKLEESGLSRAVGVCNFEIDHLEDLLETCCLKPQVNQIEMHPFQNNVFLRKFCEEQNIQVEGYCPLGKGSLILEPVVVEVAKQLSRTPAQVLIRWTLQQGAIAIPKSTKESRLKENFQATDFVIPEESMKLLSSLHDGRRIVDPTKVRGQMLLPDGYKLTQVNPFASK